MGRESRPLPASLDAELDDSERRTYLVSCLREELYASFYCQGMPVPARWGEPAPVTADPKLAAAMSEANCGRGSWEPGWTVERLNEADAVLVNSRLRARVPVADCRAPGALHPGAAVKVRVPKELLALSPGFYTVVSEAAVDPTSSPVVVRVYWNVTRASAPMLVGALSSRLNAAEVPFRLKVADHPFRLERCDAAVLYLRADNFDLLRETLWEVAAELGARLHPHIPAFTFELAPGVGLAEGDSVGESFGVRRCALLADGIVSAYARGITEADARIDAVAARFAEAGVQLDAPYLEPSLAGRHVL